MLDDLLKLFFPVKKDPKSRNDYKFKDLKANRTAVTDRVDHSKHMSWPMQQGKLGSCVGCAGTAIMQQHENKKAGNRDSNLSEMYLYFKCEEIDNHDAQGTYPKCAMQVLKNNGIPEESFWPYVAKWEHGTKPKDWADEDAAKRKIVSYYRITTLKQLQKALAEVGPVLGTFRIFENWFGDNVSTIYAGFGFSLGIHAVCICGYDLKRERIRFINSWGWEWGDSGSAWMSFDYFKKYKVDMWVPVLESSS